MSLEFVPLNDPSDLATLPDGSMITWQRIADDPTSTAVAFLHREGEDLWLSPGGWEPMGTEVIENWETVRVLIRVEPQDGEVDPGDMVMRPFDIPERTDADYRDRALTLAAQVAQSRPSSTTEHILNRASYFEAYLRGEGQQ
ncbi:hypothetical protein SEA_LITTLEMUNCHKIN_54 [Gordonia phage LittleMunchkin]|nr:hypothetical protein SEA_LITTLEMUNCHKIN_54 [Gordonia phage LittleMunchkin]